MRYDEYYDEWYECIATIMAHYKPLTNQRTASATAPLRRPRTCRHPLQRRTQETTIGEHSCALQVD